VLLHFGIMCGMETYCLVLAISFMVVKFRMKECNSLWR